MEIRQSAEDYLESILVLSKKGGGVRSIDIATRLGVSKPSVSHAMKLLREDGYIAMDRYGTVTLLEKGAEIANQIYERHIVLARMLEGLGVPAEIAMEDACKMEHDISQESFEKIKHIIITLLRRKKQQTKKHADRQSEGKIPNRLPVFYLLSFSFSGSCARMMAANMMTHPRSSFMVSF